MNKWTCQIKEAPQTITVGDKFQLVCQGQPSQIFKDNVKIILPDKKDLYRLHSLKIIYAEEDYLILEVTSYRTGEFKGSFQITDGLQTIVVDNVSFEVKSVLSQTEQAKPQGPYGPWVGSPPVWYLSALGVTVFLLVAFIFSLCFNKWKQNKLSKLVSQRLKGRLPSKVFIKSFRKLDTKSPQYLQDLDILFKTFLENTFCLPVINKSSWSFLWRLRNQEFNLYKKHKKNLNQILKELNFFKEQKTFDKVIVQLSKACKNLVFELEKDKIKQGDQK